MNVGRYSKADAALFLWEEVMTLSTILLSEAAFFSMMTLVLAFRIAMDG